MKTSLGSLTFLIAVGLVVPTRSTAGDAATDAGPVVHKPVAPAIQEKNLSTLGSEGAVKPWRPGDPVRVVNDLRTSEEAEMTPDAKPKVRKPVTPETSEKRVDELPTRQPMKPGDPVRVMEDLKEDQNGEQDRNRRK